MRYVLDEQQCRNLEVSTRREWVLPNGIGGYAMGTASGINCRRYHGHLIAATNPPTGRMLLLAAIDATIHAGANPPVGFSANQYPGAIHPEGYHYLRSFSVSDVAVWRYRSSTHEMEKTLRVHQGENAATIVYRNVGTTSFTLVLRPLLCHRDHHGNFQERPGYPEELRFDKDATRIGSGGVGFVLTHGGARRQPVQGWYYRFEYMREMERGLPPRDDLFCPCELRYELRPGDEAVLVAAVGDSEPQAQLPAGESDFRLTAQLRDAAEKLFVVTPRRTSILAGYPWFTDWGRDTMISLPGLCLHTGRIALARQLLDDYAKQLDKGLIPNRFVEAGEQPDYNTVDATLWFANAIYKTLMAEWDEPFAKRMSQVLHQVYVWHMRGTSFGIRVDPVDGLLQQGEPGVQLTWMDAKIGDWVVTPRHGKPVEINGLWVNALRIMEWLAAKLGNDGGMYAVAAQRAEDCFEQKFWHPVRGHYLDTADPTDASLRPNQVIAMALPFSPVNPEHARLALGVVARELLTPAGLRTLGPSEPGYCGRFAGTMQDRDAAYHQGTVWPWLLGPYVTALCRYTDDRTEGKRILRNAKQMLHEYGLAGIAEVYDGDEPQSPGGCPWQAWSVAEILRAWLEDCGGD